MCGLACQWSDGDVGCESHLLFPLLLCAALAWGASATAAAACSLVLLKWRGETVVRCLRAEIAACCVCCFCGSAAEMQERRGSLGRAASLLLLSAPLENARMRPKQGRMVPLL